MDMLAHGTADPLADVATQVRFARDLASILELVPESATAGGWRPVYGELLTFDEVNPPSRHRPAGGLPSRRLQHVPEGDGGGTSRDRNHACLALLDEIPIRLEKSRQ